MFSTQSWVFWFSFFLFFNYKFTVLPSLELIQTVSKREPHKFKVFSAELWRFFFVLVYLMHTWQKHEKIKSAQFFSLKLLQHLLFHILPVFEQLET